MAVNVETLEKLERKVKKETEGLVSAQGALFECKPKAFAARVLSGVEAASRSGRLLTPKPSL